MDARFGTRTGNLVVAMLFVALLLAPAVLALSGRAGFDTAFIAASEMRSPFVAPAVSTGALATGGWERDAEREIADAFPLRRSLIVAYDSVKYGMLGDSSSNQVIRGRDGWLFYGNEERRYIDGSFAPTDAQLAKLADLYAARSRFCAARGMHYVFLLAPDKSTIYAPELPAGIRLVTPTPADRLLPMMRARGVRVVDVRAALIAQSRKGEVYSRGDTHWNDAGAYAAYRALIAALRDAGVHDQIAPAAITTRIEPGGGDLLGLLGLSSVLQNDSVRADFPHRALVVPAPLPPGDAEGASFERAATARDDPALPRVVVFGDSFSQALRPFIAEDFRSAVFLHHISTTDVQFDRTFLTLERPNIVVQELAERNLVFGDEFQP